MNRFQKLISIFAAPMQRLDNAFVQLLTQRGVNTAIGAQLDVLGRLVGQPRNGQSDDLYRRYIRARIATNRSTGKREELIKIARLIIGDPTVQLAVHGIPIATCYVRVGDNVAVDSTVEAALVLFLNQAAGIAIRVIVQSNASAPNLRFKFAGGTPAGLGFDSTVTPGIGGHLADIQG